MKNKENKEGTGGGDKETKHGSGVDPSGSVAVMLVNHPVQLTQEPFVGRKERYGDYSLVSCTEV